MKVQIISCLEIFTPCKSDLSHSSVAIGAFPTVLHCTVLYCTVLCSTISPKEGIFHFLTDGSFLYIPNMKQTLSVRWMALIQHIKSILKHH